MSLWKFRSSEMGTFLKIRSSILRCLRERVRDSVESGEASDGGAIAAMAFAV
jgi:hypothetical protein